MSLLTKVFGNGSNKSSGGGGKKGADAIQAIQKLQTTIDMLNKKSSFLETKAEEERLKAKKCGKKHKTMAMQHLKRKARYLKQHKDMQGQIDTLEAQMEALSMFSHNREVVDVMRAGNDAIKANSQNIEVVEDLVDDIQEQMSMNQEVTDLLSNTRLGQEFDEGELEDELNELEQDNLDEQLLSVDTPIDVDLPSVPTSDLKDPAPAVKTDADKDQLADLAAWAM
eukprot:m.28199 g.28199  ORF g.28199 m.28199 type:complete len:225 (-) comp14096_c1_seq1:38-712(-)